MSKHDFDFVFGQWRVTNRRLKERLAGCDEWDEFEMDYEARPLLGGLANVDRMWGDFGGAPFEGASVRTYDSKNDAWTIYWMDSHDVKLSEQVSGRFVDEVGEFLGEETFKDRMRRLRFLWKAESVRRATWEQAYFDDDADAWETNWTMEFNKKD